MKLIIASNNKHKVYEIKQILADRFDGILSLSEAGVDHETVEDGVTFMENALKKAREISEITGCAALADDSGLCVDALGGAPGIFSARYAGEERAEIRDSANNTLLLKNLEGSADRSAHFTCAIALVYPDGRQVLAEGYMNGEILTSPRGESGFGYDPLFRPTGESRSVAEMSDKEKNSISHRANALKKLLEKI
jgi:XTP/dITP diphosphohydrolase